MIKRTQITFVASGRTFRPSSIGASFTGHEDPGAIGKSGRYRGLPVPAGSATFDVPEGQADGIRYLHATVTPFLPAMRQAGATDFFIHITYHYEEQCALGFDAEEMRLLAEFDCPVSIDCWDDERKMGDE